VCRNINSASPELSQQSNRADNKKSSANNQTDSLQSHKGSAAKCYYQSENNQDATGVLSPN